MKAKILEMPKSNAQLWNDLFNKFIRDWDKVQAHTAASSSVRILPADECAPGLEVSNE